MFSAHKFSIEIAAIGVGGITLPELMVADHAIKILVGLVTLIVIVMKEIDRRKNKKHE